LITTGGSLHQLASMGIREGFKPSFFETLLYVGVRSLHTWIEPMWFVTSGGTWGPLFLGAIYLEAAQCLETLLRQLASLGGLLS
jgi:hypothetical protein